MLDELDKAVSAYETKWQTLLKGRSNKSFFKALKPVAIGWKVADQQEYGRVYAELHDQCDKIVETWMNDRWIAKMHLKDAQLPGGIEIVKLMQRRPNSTDMLGLDHIDFYSLAVKDAEDILKQEPNLKWTHESNDAVDNYNWISIWFDGTEAKLKANTVIDIVIGELAEINKKITGKSK